MLITVETLNGNSLIREAKEPNNQLVLLNDEPIKFQCLNQNCGVVDRSDASVRESLSLANIISVGLKICSKCLARFRIQETSKLLDLYTIHYWL